MRLLETKKAVYEFDRDIMRGSINPVNTILQMIIVLITKNVVSGLLS